MYTYCWYVYKGAGYIMAGLNAFRVYYTVVWCSVARRPLTLLPPSLGSKSYGVQFFTWPTALKLAGLSSARTTTTRRDAGLVKVHGIPKFFLRSYQKIYELYSLTVVQDTASEQPKLTTSSLCTILLSLRLYLERYIRIMCRYGIMGSIWEIDIKMEEEINVKLYGSGLNYRPNFNSLFFFFVRPSVSYKSFEQLFRSFRSTWTRHHVLELKLKCIVVAWIFLVFSTSSSRFRSQLNHV